MCRDDLPELAVFENGNAAAVRSGQDRSTWKEERAVHGEGGTDLWEEDWASEVRHASFMLAEVFKGEFSHFALASCTQCARRKHRVEDWEYCCEEASDRKGDLEDGVTYPFYRKVPSYRLSKSAVPRSSILLK